MWIRYLFLVNNQRVIHNTPSPPALLCSVIILIFSCVISRGKSAGRVWSGPGAGRVESLCEWSSGSWAAGLVFAQHYSQWWLVCCSHCGGSHHYGCQWQQPHLQPGQEYREAKRRAKQTKKGNYNLVFVSMINMFWVVFCQEIERVHFWIYHVILQSVHIINATAEVLLNTVEVFFK